MIRNEELNQFKPGESGNPSGRPRGSRNLSTILAEMLEEEIEITEAGVKSKKKFADVIVRKLIRKANEGDIKAIQVIFDRTEGQAKQEIKINGEISNQESGFSQEEREKILDAIDKSNPQDKS